jgi:hypothetical protein
VATAINVVAERKSHQSAVSLPNQRDREFESTPLPQPVFDFLHFRHYYQRFERASEEPLQWLTALTPTRMVRRRAPRENLTIKNTMVN